VSIDERELWYCGKHRGGEEREMGPPFNTWVTVAQEEGASTPESSNHRRGCHDDANQPLHIC
jgi:hypothetical protein